MLRLLPARGLRAAGFLRARNYSKKEKKPTFAQQVKDVFHPPIQKIDQDWWDEKLPIACDILVIGGGAMGISVAYWLKQKIPKELHVVVVEKDPTYSKASTCLSVGGLRQQFSLEENIHMSLYGAHFLRNVNEYLGIQGEDPVDVCFHPYGYLMLATEKSAETLMNNSKLQNTMGAKNILLSPQKLKELFPWITVDGLALGCLGVDKEGWFDPWSLLSAFKKKVITLGVDYVHAEAKSFETMQEENVFHRVGDMVYPLSRLQALNVELPNGEQHTIKFSKVVIAAGAFSGEIGKMAGLGIGPGALSVPLPVEPRKRYVYCFHCADGPGLNTPLTIDPSGTYFRREGLGGQYICGRSPAPEEEPPVDNLDVDHEYFQEKVWPMLAQRVKAFENLKVNSSWAGYYEYNTFDRNGIIGQHPHHTNLYIATGFSGHGIQQSPAVGRAMAELILNRKYETIDLTRLGFRRIIDQTPMLEDNIV